MTSFEELGLSPWLVKTCAGLGMKTATPVQAATVGPILEGKNVLASAETGTGKTAAFSLPILEKLAEDPFGVFAVVLEPTRELALQVYETMHALGVRKRVRVETVVGGIDVVEQGLHLSKRPHILVGTPGRLADFVRREVVDLSRVRYLVVDEADRLLDNSFSEDLSDILEASNPKSRQTLLFSATVSKTLETLANNFADGVFRYDAKSRKYQTVEKLQQEYYLVPEDIKECYLAHLLLVQFAGESSVVFVSEKTTCEKLLWFLRELGIKCMGLHSDMKQSDREQSLAMFKNTSVPVLVATDLASRGLDVPTVALVVNFDLPDRAATYVHRVGRTARIGRPGVAVSLVSQYDVELIQGIEAKINVKLTERESAAETEKEIVKELLSKVTRAKRVARLAMAESRTKVPSITSAEKFGNRTKTKKRRKDVPDSK
mmetsp:Transcript_7289/g.22206  ORF Transcript_7289/g.22206 Transcript_7289/m.22206 type:complete len:432 (-) Transcript_7289:1788-3083(-)